MVKFRMSDRCTKWDKGSIEVSGVWDIILLGGLKYNIHILGPSVNSCDFRNAQSLGLINKDDLLGCSIKIQHSYVGILGKPLLQ